MMKLMSAFGAFFMAITFHEFAHALIAYFLGDDTAKKAGRLTLNPLAHIDLIGFIFLVLFRFGWAKPVPMNMHNFKYPRFYSVIAAMAGPFSNILLALVCLYLITYLPILITMQTSSIGSFIREFLVSSVHMNVMLGVFNVLPIPPLDGSHIIVALIPTEKLAQFYRLMPFFIMGLMIIVMLPPTQLFLMDSMNFVISILKKLVL